MATDSKTDVRQAVKKPWPVKMVVFYALGLVVLLFSPDILDHIQQWREGRGVVIYFYPAKKLSYQRPLSYPFMWLRQNRPYDSLFESFATTFMYAVNTAGTREEVTFGFTLLDKHVDHDGACVNAWVDYESQYLHLHPTTFYHAKIPGSEANTGMLMAAEALDHAGEMVMKLEIADRAIQDVKEESEKRETLREQGRF